MVAEIRAFSLGSVEKALFREELITEIRRLIGMGHETKSTLSIGFSGVARMSKDSSDLNRCRVAVEF